MKIFNLLGQEYTVSNDLEKYNYYKNLFNEKALSSARTFHEMYEKNILNLDVLINKVTPLASELIIKCIKSVIPLLVDEGIMTLDEFTFFNKYYYDYFEFEKYYYPILEKYVDITEAHESLKSYRELQKATRSRWQGGGFGVSGAIKGAITAGALNMGTDFVRSVGDSSRSQKDADQINSLKMKVFNNPETFSLLHQGIYYCIIGVFEGFIDELVEHRVIKKINLNPNESKIIFENTVKYEKSPDKILNNLMKSLMLNPYYFEIYKFLLEGAENKREIVEMALFFGFGNESEIIKEDVDYIIANENIDFSDNSKENYSKCKNLIKNINSQYREIPNIKSYQKLQNFIKKYETDQQNEKLDDMFCTSKINIDSVDDNNYKKCVDIIDKMKGKDHVLPNSQLWLDINSLVKKYEEQKRLEERAYNHSARGYIPKILKFILFSAICIPLAALSYYKIDISILKWILVILLSFIPVGSLQEDDIPLVLKFILGAIISVPLSILIYFKIDSTIIKWILIFFISFFPFGSIIDDTI